MGVFACCTDIVPHVLPQAIVGQPYSANLTFTPNLCDGGADFNGTLPAGLILTGDPLSGQQLTISGTPTQSGNFTLNFSRVANGCSALNVGISLVVAAPVKKKKRRVGSGIQYWPIPKFKYPNGAPVTLPHNNQAYYLHSEDQNFYYYATTPPSTARSSWAKF